MTTTADFVKEILRLRKTAGPGYGDNVIPAISLFESLGSYELRMAYLGALEKLLTPTDPEIRKYAVTLCVGFVVFRDSFRGPAAAPGSTQS